MDNHLTQMLNGSELVIAPWHDPLAAQGFPADSDDTLVYLTPILGPSAVLALHRMSRYLTADGATGAILGIEDMANSFGLTLARFRQTIARLENFGMVRATPTTLHVRMMIPPLPQRWLERMPAFLAEGCPWRA